MSRAGEMMGVSRPGRRSRRGPEPLRANRPRRRRSTAPGSDAATLRPRVPSPAWRPVARDPGGQGGRRPAHAPRETLPLAPGDVVAPAHHELLDLAPVIRRPGGAVSMAAPGLRPGPWSGHLPHSPLPRSGKVQPERPRGADPEVTPCYHVLGQKRVVRSGVAQALFTIGVAIQSVLWARLKCLFFSNLTFRGRDIRVAPDVVFGSSRWLPRIGSRPGADQRADQGV